MPNDEADRLAALRRFGILDTPPEVRFDELVQLAASICGTEMAAVSLVDEQRQWFKARVGLDVEETPISDAFCAHTITQRDVLEVPDATSDDRFATSALVVGEPHLRFYAAAPLVTAEGFAIGTVCVLDRTPHSLDDSQRRALRALADQAMALMVLHQQAQALEVARHHALLVLDTANDAYVQIDAAGAITDWNRRATEVFGWSRDEVLGRRLADVIIPERHRAAHVRGVAEAAARAEAHESQTLVEGLEVAAMRRDGSEIPAEVTLWSTRTAELGVRFSGFVRDVTDRRALEERLAHDALHDELTGLPNRQLLRDRLEHALTRVERDGRLVGVLFCDLDRFKVVNDSSGHSVGDQVLVQVAARLTDTVRAADTVVRFGGDEFVVVVDGVDDALEVADLADRVRDALSRPLHIDGHEVPTSVSIGYAVSGNGAGVERLVSDADAAMYVAKEQGRNRVEPFGAELQARVMSRLDEERALRRALDEHELVLHYQPIVSLPTGRVLGAEALVRWERPGHGLVHPEAFVPLAEETGLIVELGDWVLDTAFAQLRAWRDALPGSEPTMAVNVSPRQLARGMLAATVAAAIRRHGVEASAITVELTESTLMEDLAWSAGLLDELRDVGVSVAIDDFGTGYSSLAYLKSLPIDTLKIDRAFVANLGRDAYDSAIVEAVASIGRTLGLRVVAEGVESAELAAQVLAHGCELAQGHHFGAAVVGSELAPRFATGDDVVRVEAPS